MDRSSKLLVILVALFLFAGFGLLWFGTNQGKQVELVPSALLVVESSPIATQSAEVVVIAGDKAAVTRVVDGDTIEITGGKMVRFIGIDTPETKDPRRPVGCFGKEASSETKKLLEGKTVILQKDVSETDKYKRLLRYIFLPLENNQVLFVNDYLVREGFAKVLTYPPDVKFNEQLREAEKEARENQRGLWQKCQ